MRLQRKQDNNALKVTLVSIPKKPKTNTTRTSAVLMTSSAPHSEGDKYIIICSQFKNAEFLLHFQKQQ
jgi:hypothetical protein